MDYQDANLEIIIQKLKAKYSPLRLFLHGSRANGTAKPDSDYDFVMVLSDFEKSNRHQMMSTIAKDFYDLNLQVQVWTYSLAEFNDWKDEFSSIPETALNTGKEINLD